ncbi:hypothetical protein NQ317_007127 [Molorchus minor]|uniref:Uncharacterized protein n=1 Tax=Molorchus minor TaxID=1323400 RepID=A0ABQ9JYM1_9CUCU|nr:hypothetical protein NQ317_007127 [Molorchus minor]
MMRFTGRAVNIFGNILKQKSHVVIDHRHLSTLVKIPTKFLQNVQHFSNDVKSKSPLGSLIAKDADQKQEKTDEEKAQKQREQSWKTMKLTLAFFGISFTCLGAYLVITLGAPEKIQMEIQ